MISKKNTLTSAILFIAVFHLNSSYATGLMDAYQAALANDSAFRSAIHENEAGQQYKAIGRANLLPIVSASYAYNRVNSDITATNSGLTREEIRNYNSENGILQLRQPIFNMESWARFKQGNLQADLSEKQFESHKQEFIKRFFALYANADFAEDILALSEAEHDAFKNQYEANKKMMVGGEGTKTALIESQAKLSLSEAQVLEAQSGLADARNSLATMLGKEVSTLARLSERFDVESLTPVDYESWKSIALENNPELAAQHKDVAIAYQEVRRNQAGHSPRLDAVASISRSKSDSTSTFNQEIDNKSIGLQLNIPIYSGGSVSALTAQAEANYQKAQDDLETKTNEILLDLRKQHNALASSALKIAALKQSVSAAELLVTATAKSMAGGVRTNLDLLDARKQQFEAKRDLSLARYSYLVAYVNLKKAAGTLTVNDLEKIAPYFISKPDITGNK